MNVKENAWSEIDRKKDWICSISDAIWEHPETSFEEHFAAGILCQALEQEGFEVKRGLAGIETAFSGRFGGGAPVIGILGEYDALSGMSQKADIFHQEEVMPGGNGHGCGHNLLGAGSLAAAIAIKHFLTETGISGTVIYYGCPGEEGGAGKAFMAREGIFDELDCALSWHPGDINAGPAVKCLANQEVLYRFHGTSSHAAASPHLGRSALDAVTLFNTGVQFLREHIIPEARIHYAVTNTGGFSPNVVQSEAEAVYLIRAPKISQVKEINARVDDVAKGAALMTGTSVDIQFIKACADIVPNRTLSSVLAANLQEVPANQFTKEELAYAAEIQSTLPVKDSLIAAAEKLGPKVRAFVKPYIGEPIHSFAVPDLPVTVTLPSSTDVGDVSWLCPTGQIQAATMCCGTPAHSWQRTAQGKSSIAHKGLIYAGKVMAGGAIDLYLNPETVKEARREWEEQLNGERYQPIPREVMPSAVHKFQTE